MGSRSEITVCEETAETANEAWKTPDLHWCNVGVEGHAGEHRCACGLVWTEEVPC